MKLTIASKQNLFTYAVFLAIALAGIYYGRAITHSYAFVRVWDFTNLVLMLVGIPFLFLQSRAGLPEFWDSTISHKKRILYPLLIGICFGLLDILIVKVMMHPAPYTELPPFLQPFPYSVFLYVSGAFEVEVFYRLIPLTLILLLGKWFKSGQYYTYFVWTGMLLTALREPLEQFPDGNLAFILYSLITGILMNAIQAFYFTKAGFVASIGVRLGHYLLWHILLGMYVQFVELP